MLEQNEVLNPCRQHARRQLSGLSFDSNEDHVYARYCDERLRLCAAMAMGAASSDAM